MEARPCFLALHTGVAIGEGTAREVGQVWALRGSSRAAWGLRLPPGPFCVGRGAVGKPAGQLQSGTNSPVRGDGPRI